MSLSKVRVQLIDGQWLDVADADIWKIGHGVMAFALSPTGEYVAAYAPGKWIQIVTSKEG